MTRKQPTGIFAQEMEQRVQIHPRIPQELYDKVWRIVETEREASEKARQQGKRVKLFGLNDAAEIAFRLFCDEYEARKRGGG
jgi:hypothetical protein